jgi:hypothetical protein
MRNVDPGTHKSSIIRYGVLGTWFRFGRKRCPEPVRFSRLSRKCRGANALFSWIDNYCRSNPRDLFPIAVMNLIIELRKGTHSLVGYEIDPEYTQTSPDGAITIEQYVNKDTDDYKWQFWIRRQDTFTLLDPEPADYPANFLFTQRSKLHPKI